MRRKVWMVIGCAAAIVFWMAAAWFGWQYCIKTWFRLDGTIYRRDAAVVDLREQGLSDVRALAPLYGPQELDIRNCGVSIQDYEWLRSRFPACSITWELPFQGAWYPLDTTRIQLDRLEEGDIALLDYLPELETVDAWECTDYEALHALQTHRPDCQVLYYVRLTDTIWSTEAEELTLKDASAREITENLPLLYRVKRVMLTGSLPAYEEITSLQEQFPQVEFTWEAKLGGRVYPWDLESADLEGTAMTAERAAAELAYFPKLQEVNFRDTGLTDGEMQTLADTFPGCFFLWDMEVMGRKFPTDTQQMDLSRVPFEDTEAIEAVLPYFPKLEKVIMSDCGLDSETMDALDGRHEDVRFVWTVYLGGVVVRTDDTWFMPVKFGKEVRDRDLEELRYCRDMVCIDLGHNHVTHCEWAREMPHLRYLLLADTPLRDISPLENHTELVYLELFLTSVRDTTPLLSCTALEDLNLCYTLADPEPVSQMTWLKRLWWAGCWNASKVIPGTLPDTEICMDTASSTGAGWRKGKLYYEMRDYLGMWYMYG